MFRDADSPPPHRSNKSQSLAVRVQNNRGFARLRLKKYAEAELDATAVLSVELANAKALFRRAKARFGLEKWSDAAVDLRRVVELQPDNTVARKDLETAEHKLEVLRPRAAAAIKAAETHRKLPIAEVDSDSDDCVEPVSAERVATRKHPSRKLLITEVDDDSGDEAEAATVVQPATKLQPRKLPITEVDSDSDENDDPQVQQMGMKSPTRKLTVTEVDSDEESDDGAVVIETFSVSPIVSPARSKKLPITIVDSDSEEADEAEEEQQQLETHQHETHQQGKELGEVQQKGQQASAAGRNDCLNLSASGVVDGDLPKIFDDLSPLVTTLELQNNS
eukprot:SAG11_NODE_11_length_27870_cov_16.327428_14_plen_335_part_00